MLPECISVASGSFYATMLVFIDFMTFLRFHCLEMGAALTYLDDPVTKAHLDRFRFPSRASGSAGSMQGWRRDMEDSHCYWYHEPSDTALFGVFDGHGGKGVSLWVARRLPQIIEANENFKKGEYARALHESFMALDVEMHSDKSAAKLIRELQETNDPDAPEQLISVDMQTLLGIFGGADSAIDGVLRIKENVTPTNVLTLLRSSDPLHAIFEGPLLHRFTHKSGDTYFIHAKHVFEALDREPSAESQGCTATVALVDFKNGRVYCANAGDSRAVLARDGKAAALSVDHKPTQQLERRRVLAAGGKIIGKGENARIEGDLNLSRSLGDLRYKQNKNIAPELQIISARPDIRTRQLCKSDRFIVIACDGIWEKLTSQDCVTLLTDKLKKVDVSSAIEEMFQSCICKSMDPEDGDCDFTGCDNMTLLVIELDPSYTSTLPETSEESLHASAPQTFGRPVPELQVDSKKRKKGSSNVQAKKARKDSSD